MISADCGPLDPNQGFSPHHHHAAGHHPHQAAAAAHLNHFANHHSPQFFTPSTVTASTAIGTATAKMNINVSPNPLGTVYATKRRRRSNKR